MELKNKKRILIIGGCGTGKSTFAKILGKKLQLDVIHLDKCFWKPNWSMRDYDEFTDIVRNLALNEEWIMEGNYSKTLSVRAPRAELIFFFDFPSFFCVYRILKRNIKSKLRFEIRDDMAEGCHEKWFDWDFVKFTWNFKKDIAPLNYKILEDLNFSPDRLIVFNSQREVNKFIRVFI